MKFPWSGFFLWATALCLAVDVACSQPDSLGMQNEKHRPHWGMPLLEISGTNAGIASFNKWISQKDYGQVSLNSMRRNLGGGMVWDEDNFVVNQMGHPYQGGLYYSSARYYGGTFAQGLGYAAMGSLQWEYLLETERPAINDLITTTLGGAMLGEITYRLSLEILDDGSHGTERFLRESLAALVNPIHGLNRMLDGSAFKSTGRVSVRKAQSHPVAIRVSTSGILDFKSNGSESAITGIQRVPKGNTEFVLKYGDEFSIQRPFDFFVLRASANFVQDPIASISARAQLGSSELFSSGQRTGHMVFGQHFDYINSGIYKVGTSGFGFGYSHQFRLGGKWTHTFHTDFGVILLGGVSTEFFRKGERDYMLGPGAFSTSRVTLGREGSGHLAFVVDRYWLFSASGVSGNERIGNGQVEFSKSIYKSIGSILSYSFYNRTASYEQYPDQTRFNQEVRLGFSFGFQ